MNWEWSSVRNGVRLAILVPAVLIVVVAISVILFMQFTANREDPMPDLNEIVRTWAEYSIEHMAGDELVDFIVSKSFTEEPDLLSEYLKDGLKSATTWYYGPVVRVSDVRYELTATASTRVHDILPLTSIKDRSGAVVPLEQDDFSRVATMPFHLTVDMDSKSVTDWYVQLEEGTYVTTMNPAKLANVETVEEAFGSSSAECIETALGKDISQSDIDALLQPPGMRREIDAVRLSATLSALGLGALCKEWIGELP